MPTRSSYTVTQAQLYTAHPVVARQAEPHHDKFSRFPSLKEKINFHVLDGVVP
jgi:hypothetical protein